MRGSARLSRSRKGPAKEKFQIIASKVDWQRRQWQRRISAG